jgi:hypothetical protein
MPIVRFLNLDENSPNAHTALWFVEVLTFCHQNLAQIELEKYTITSPISGVIKNLPNQRNVVNINAPKVLMIIEAISKSR